jgi:hypothetical protein
MLIEEHITVRYHLMVHHLPEYQIIEVYACVQVDSINNPSSSLDFEIQTFAF